MIGLEDVHNILIETMKIKDQSTDVGIDDTLTIDSVTMVWILHFLEDRHNIEVNLGDPALGSLSSVRDFYSYLSDRFPEQVSPQE